MIYNYSQTCFISLARIIRAKITLNKCMQHSCFTSMFHMFQSIVSVIICMIRHVWLGCLMMHNMHDLQCLNACITPGCYTFLISKYQATLLIAISCDTNNKLVSLVFALVEKENNDSWGWFLRLVWIHLVGPGRELASYLIGIRAYLMPCESR